MSRIVCDGWDAKRRAAVQEVQFEIGLKVLKLGGDVVLDFGLFHREERDRYRADAVAVRAETKTFYLDVPKDELLRRLRSRNAELPPQHLQSMKPTWTIAFAGSNHLPDELN